MTAQISSFNTCSVYFRISLKRGQTPSTKIQRGGGGGPYSKGRESQFLRGPPEMNPDMYVNAGICMQQDYLCWMI